MSAFVPDVGELTILGAVRTSVLQGAILELWVNDFQPGQDTILSDLTILSDPQYAPIPLNSWGVPAIGSDGRAITEHPVVQWSFPNPIPGTVLYGNALHDGVNLIYVRRFLNPIDASVGQVLVPQAPRFTLSDDS